VQRRSTASAGENVEATQATALDLADLRERVGDPARI